VRQGFPWLLLLGVLGMPGDTILMRATRQTDRPAGDGGQHADGARHPCSPVEDGTDDSA